MNKFFRIFQVAVFLMLVSTGTNGKVTVMNTPGTTPNLALTYRSLIDAISVGEPDKMFAATETVATPITKTGGDDEIDATPIPGTPRELEAGQAGIAELNAPVITYTVIPSPSCIFSGITISGVTITDASGIPLSGVYVPRIYYKKNTGSWFSRPGTITGGTSTSSTWNFTIVETDMGGLSGGEVISYYIIAQDIVIPQNIGSNPAAGLVASDVNNVTTHPTSPNTYTLRYNFNGIYTVGVGGNFATLTAAVNAYNNACTLSGATIFELIDNSYPSETFPITISNHADASVINTLTIRPSAMATPVITGNTITQTFNLNGAKYIRFDGRQAGVGIGKSMTITNSNIAIAINFINDAQNNIIKYCIVKGQRVSTVSGTISFGTTTSPTGTGNDYNSIENNDITEAGGFSSIGIFSSGTVGKENDNITVSNNNISNYFNATGPSYGIYVLSFSNSWTITGNRLFQTATRVYTATSNHFGIYVNAGSSHSITNNIIGFANEAGTGTTNMIGNSVMLAGFPSSYSPSGTGQQIRYVGIGVALALTGPVTKIDGNIIGGIAMYTSSSINTAFGIFGGIYVESGRANIGATTGNIIGGTTGNNSIYVATINGGSVIAIRSAAIGTAAIQNNTIGSITVSGSSSSNTGRFTAISLGGACSFNISDNSIGNAEADNIRVGYTQLGGLASNAGSMVATNAGVSTIIKGIASGSSLSLSVTGNIFRGWVNSCRNAAITGIETSGLMLGPAPSIDINNNFFGTAGTNWLNAVVDNIGTLYAMNVTNTAATIYNIKDNDIRGTIFGTQNGVGGGLIRLLGANSANAISTISGNTFSNVSFRFSTGDLYFIYTNYSIASTGALIIDGNRIIGNFNGNGNAQYHMVHCDMTAAAGSKASIVNNDFSNITSATGFTSDLYGLYSSFGGGACLLTVFGNNLNNWSSGDGIVVGIDITNVTGTVSCGSNIISGIASRGDIEAISLSGSGSSGQFDIMNNTVASLVSSGAGGYIYGISAYLPSIANTTQTNIYRNIVNSLSSTASGIITGIFLDKGHPSATVSVADNKVYDISGSSTGSQVYGISNYTTLSGNIIYTNNYIGDLRAPLSTLLPSVAGIKLFMIGGQAKAYYNTIHLNASGSAGLFSTAAVYADPATTITLRNNIFSNLSAHGASGKTVAYWRGDTNLGSYDAASNNNDFYAGIPSAQNLVYFDGTNSDQAIGMYKARVTPRDNLSVSELPNFISTSGADADFLHLSASGNCGIAAGGSNSGILLATDYDSDSRSTTIPFLTDIGADEITKTNSWTGVNGNNWNDAGNWSEGIVPNSIATTVSISNPPAVQPVIGAGEVFQVGNLAIQAGAGLTNQGTLNVGGTIYTGAGSINNLQAGNVVGSIEMNGNCPLPQLLAGNIFVSNSVKNLTVSNNLNVSVIAGEHINVSGALSFGAVAGRTLNTGDNITLRSTAAATANVGDLTGNTIIGKATVERFINTGLIADGRHLKSWQFLSAPTSGQTIFQSWQESGSVPAGYGTIITGTGTGFDVTTILPSMKIYDNSTNNWSGITNTGNLLNDRRGYMIFVRGDRSVTAYNQNAVPTTLRTTGTLYQPTALPPVSVVQPGKFESVGNPYASAIDVAYMKDNGLFVNLDNNVTVWDPLLAGTYNFGGYQSLSAANNYEPTAGSTATSYYPAGVSSPFIQSGQAFFVHSSGAAGSVTFTEASKESSSRLVNRPPVNHSARRYFRTTLFTNTGVIADGNAVVYDPVFRNRIDADDAFKILNTGENFALRRHNKILAVEARMPVQRTDTIFYEMSNLRRQAYQLRFAPVNMRVQGMGAFLMDRFLGITTALSLLDSSFVNISVTDDPASAAPDRFYVVFKGKRVAPVFSNSVMPKLTRGASAVNNLKAGSISVYPNPVTGKVMYVHFINQAPGIYQLQLTNKMGQVVSSKEIRVNNSIFIGQVKLNALATGSYQLSIHRENGMKQVLQVVVK